MLRSESFWSSKTWALSFIYISRGCRVHYYVILVKNTCTSVYFNIISFKTERGPWEIIKIEFQDRALQLEVMRSGYISSDVVLEIKLVVVFFRKYFVWTETAISFPIVCLTLLDSYVFGRCHSKVEVPTPLDLFCCFPIVDRTVRRNLAILGTFNIVILTLRLEKRFYRGFISFSYSA